MADDINVTIYLKTVRAHFNKMTDIERLYFYENKDEDVFFDRVREYAIKNYQKSGEPTLTVDQFEDIKQSLKIETNNGTYVDYKLIGRIYLN